jgi:hypothetical protein
VPGATATAVERRARFNEDEEFAQNPNEDEIELEPEARIEENLLPPRPRETQTMGEIPSTIRTKEERQKLIAQLLSLLAQDKAEENGQQPKAKGSAPKPRRPYSLPVNNDQVTNEEIPGGNKIYSPPMTVAPETRSGTTFINHDMMTEKGAAPRPRRAYSPPMNANRNGTEWDSAKPPSSAQHEHSLLQTS